VTKRSPKVVWARHDAALAQAIRMNLAALEDVVEEDGIFFGILLKRAPLVEPMLAGQSCTKEDSAIVSYTSASSRQPAL
jgi:hypothetical protein